ncbi:MAG: YHS domain-containing protein [Deltaproteobacteria bacterium]|nr:YHS domain-containing protein [Deltaproteobacteria bacterium]
MSKVISWSLALAAVALLGGAACAKKEQPSPPAVGGELPPTSQAGEADAWYVCPMPADNYWQKGPGRCPKCGMDLERAPEGWVPPAGPTGACTGGDCGVGGTAESRPGAPGGMAPMAGMEHGATGGPSGMGEMPGMQHAAGGEGSGMGGMQHGAPGGEPAPGGMAGMEHGMAAAPDAGSVAAAPAGGDKAWYVCPMHPQVYQDHPGDCPICHMNLVPAPAGWAPPADAGASAAPQAPAIRTAKDLAPERLGQQATCPVTGDTFTVTDETPAVEYQGTVYLFCCAACPPRFLADPQRYGAPPPAGS